MSSIKLIYNLFYSLRPYQWTKNLVVFAAILFAGEIFNLTELLNVFYAFLLFSLIAGSGYIINDIIDIEQDKRHPFKKWRPIAAGKITIGTARIFGFLLLCISIGLAVLLNRTLGIILISYFFMTLAYSLKLKHIVILDIIIVATGFVLRAVAGAVVIDAVISPWLLVCTFFLALFLVIGKRRAELVSLKEEAGNHRAILEHYQPRMLDQMIAVVTAMSVVSYAQYTLDASTVFHLGNNRMIFTIPFVIYGIFRYFYLIYKKELGGSPEKILINDRGILINLFLWTISVGYIIYSV
ncbi:MAG: decaprenyl-phosphate phosphoribosyltransferase [Calditrichaceae bacterium]